MGGPHHCPGARLIRQAGLKPRCFGHVLSPPCPWKYSLCCRPRHHSSPELGQHGLRDGQCLWAHIQNERTDTSAAAKPAKIVLGEREGQGERDEEREIQKGERRAREREESTGGKRRDARKEMVRNKERKERRVGKGREEGRHCANTW